MSINSWGSDDPAEVAKGGTGAGTLTDGGILLGSGTSPVSATAQPTDGQLLIGNTGGDPSLAAPTGAANEIAVAATGGALSIGIADDCVLPGTNASTWVSGTTAQEPSGSVGQARYDSDTDAFRGYTTAGGWQDFLFSGSSGLGKVLQFAYDTNTASVAISAWSIDNSVPLATEGTEVLSVTLSPVSASSNLLCIAHGTVHETSADGALALFRDTDPAFAGSVCSPASSGSYTQQCTVIGVSPSASTSSTTVSCRASGDRFNSRNDTLAYFGNAGAGYLVVLEIG